MTFIICKDGQRNKCSSSVEIFTSFNTTNNESGMEELSNKMENPISSNENTPKVTGIGGIFFFSDNPKKFTKVRIFYRKDPPMG